MYYLANLRNKKLINQIIHDTSFKPKHENKEIY